MSGTATLIALATTTSDVDVIFMSIPTEMIKDASHSIVKAKNPKISKKKKKAGAVPSLKGFPFINLHPEIIMNIMDHLSVTENACLALTCKFLASIATSHNSLTVKASTAVLRHIGDPALSAWHLEVTDFFKYLQKGWIPRSGPRSLKYCRRCSKFRPNTPEYWMEYGKKKVVKYGGLVGKNWTKVLRSGSNMIGERIFFSRWTITCPGCAIENPGGGW